MKVAKFGGSSVSTAEQIKKVLTIVNEDPERKIIIVSAPGKRHNDDIKTTDLLIRLYEKVLNKLNYESKKQEIIQRYADIVEELGIGNDILITINDTLNDYVEEILKILSETVLNLPVKFNEIRYSVDNRNESLGKKIREATAMKIPVQLIVGPKDKENNETDGEEWQEGIADTI
ncbi:MAG: His/Gly/Thr/Pro-type tRNA ligase C-terminal domain-containing protein [Staphylococcus epidermidis]|nr:His/Gly/Thr/Pro-type tRNA ligase C-terminal domain-containing protein [Staphylococcus epidermidis]